MRDTGGALPTSFAIVAGEVGVKNIGYPVGDIRRYGAQVSGAGTVDSTAAFQSAHDSLGANGGVITVPDGLWLLGTDGVYVTISKPNVSVLGTSANAWVISPASSDPEIKTGNRYLNGFAVNATGFVISVNMRGPLVLWTPQTANDVIAMRNMIFRNLYNAGLSISSAAFDTADVDGVTFDTSRDLTSDPGNYEAISRSANSTDGTGNLIRVMRCTFRAVSGGLDAHNVRNLEIGAGTRFEGIDINAIKLATLDNGVVEQNLTVDDTVTFDGTPINPASVNRHLNLTPQAADRTNTGTRYMGFIQVFNNIQWHGRTKNAPNNGVTFLDGTFTNAVINLDGAKFDTCPNAIIDAQGKVSMCRMEVLTSTILWTVAGKVRQLDFIGNRMRDSVVKFTKNSVDNASVIRCEWNDIDYSVDNLGPIRFVNYGVDAGMVLLVDNNRIILTGGANFVVADLAVAGTLGVWLPGNRCTAAAGTPVITGGLFPAVYEQATAAGTYSLFLSWLHHGEITVRNPNAAGNITYDIRDAALNAQIGTMFYVFRDHAANNLAFLATTMRGAQGTGATATATTQFANAILKKVAAGSWVLISTGGTWTIV